MGLVVSAIGFGGFLGQFGLPGLSSLVGRRLASIVGFAGTAVMLYIFRGLGPQPLALFGVLFVASFFTLGLVSLLSGPVATEAAPIGPCRRRSAWWSGSARSSAAASRRRWAATSPHTGIQNILWLPMCAVMLGIVVSLLLKETAPAVLQRRMAAVQPELAAGEQSR